MEEKHVSESREEIAPLPQTLPFAVGKATTAEDIGALVIARRPGQAIRIAGPCRIVIVGQRGRQTIVRVEADRRVPVIREELIGRERRQAG